MPPFSSIGNPSRAILMVEHCTEAQAFNHNISYCFIAGAMSFRDSEHCADVAPFAGLFEPDATIMPNT